MIVTKDHCNKIGPAMPGLRTAFLAAALGLLTPLSALACTMPAGAEARMAQELAAINAYRRQAGLSAVTPSKTLSKIAQAHACDMKQMGKYSHVGSNGSDLKQRLKAGGYRFRTAVENVGQFQATTGAAQWWYGSRGHRANLLSPGIREAGLGVALGADRKYYWVMVGGKSR